MPNWAKGYLKVRGKTADIFDFIENGMSYVGEILVGEYGVAERPIKIDRDDFLEELEIPLSKQVFGEDADKVFYQSIYIKGTHRNFIRNGVDEILKDLNETSVLVFSGFEAAWGVDVPPYVEISKKFNIEIKIEVYERGMEFSQHIYIKDGEVYMDEKRKYDDWKWDCPCPDFGG